MHQRTQEGLAWLIQYPDVTHICNLQLKSCISQLSSDITFSIGSLVGHSSYHKQLDGPFDAQGITGRANHWPTYQIRKNLNVSQCQLKYQLCKRLTVGWENQLHKPWLFMMWFPHPPSSPILNLIEPVWHKLKKIVQALSLIPITALECQGPSHGGSYMDEGTFHIRIGLLLIVVSGDCLAFLSILCFIVCLGISNIWWYMVVLACCLLYSQFMYAPLRAMLLDHVYVYLHGRLYPMMDYVSRVYYGLITPMSADVPWGFTTIILLLVTVLGLQYFSYWYNNTGWCGL